MNRPTLRTDRLELVPMTLANLPLLHTLDADPEVMRHILGRARTTSEIDAFWTPHCTDTAADSLGLGWWIGFHHETFVGWWALMVSATEASRPADQITPEAGWRLRRDCWGQGFATEGAQALLRHAFETVKVPSVWAETMAINHASRAVMRKIGMRHIRAHHPLWAEPLPGDEVFCQITHHEWQTRNPESLI